MKRSRIAAVALAGVATLVLASCAAGGGGEDSNKLTYWSMWQQGEPQQVVLQQAIDAFTAETGIQVDVQWSGRAVLAQVATALNAGNAPDLVDQDGPSLVAALGPTNAAADVSGILSGKDADGDDLSAALIPGLADPFTNAAGDPIVVPYELTGSTLWFNAKTDPDLASNPPATWSDFQNWVDGRVDDGRTPVAVDTDLAMLDCVWTSYSIVRHGGVGALQTAALDKSGQTFLTDPAFAAAGDDILPLTSPKVIGQQGTQWPAQQTAWADGSAKSDVLLQGTWIPSETSAALKQAGLDPADSIEYGSMAFPTVPDGKGNDAVNATPIGFSILDGQNSSAAEQFVKFFLTKKNLTPIATDAQNVTSRSDIAAPDVLKTYADSVKNASATFLDDDGTGMVAPDWVKNVYQSVCSDLFYGKITSGDDFANQLASKTASFYKGQ